MRRQYFDPDLVRTAAHVLVNGRAVSGLDCRSLYEHVRDTSSGSTLFHRVVWHFLEAAKESIDTDVYDEKLSLDMQPAEYRDTLISRLLPTQESSLTPQIPETVQRMFAENANVHALNLFTHSLIHVANVIASALRADFANAGLAVLPLDIINKNKADTWGKMGHRGIASLINEVLDVREERGIQSPIARPSGEEIYLGHCINLDRK